MLHMHPSRPVCFFFGPAFQPFQLLQSLLFSDFLTIKIHFSKSILAREKTSGRKISTNLANTMVVIWLQYGRDMRAEHGPADSRDLILLFSDIFRQDGDNLSCPLYRPLFCLLFSPIFSIDTSSFLCALSLLLSPFLSKYLVTSVAWAAGQEMETSDRPPSGRPLPPSFLCRRLFFFSFTAAFSFVFFFTFVHIYFPFSSILSPV